MAGGTCYTAETSLFWFWQEQLGVWAEGLKVDYCFKSIPYSTALSLTTFKNNLNPVCVL